MPSQPGTVLSVSTSGGARAGVGELAVLLALLLLLAACGSSSSSSPESAEAAPSTPGGYDFDRSDPEAGIANIMEAFATDRATAECIYDAWGDVANVPPGELTPELMTFPICDTSILQLMTGDAGFTGGDLSDDR